MIKLENGCLFLEKNGVIPEGCTYTTKGKIQYNEGEVIKTDAIDGDVFETEDYIYTCISMYNHITNVDEFVHWEVRVKDKGKAKYEPLYETINGYNLWNVNGLFADCSNMIESPAIPNVIEMDETYASCVSLEVPPVIPYTVTSLYDTFYGCVSLKTPPYIHNGVECLEGTFYGCSSMEYLPEFPECAEYDESTYADCDSLKGEIKIRKKDEQYRLCYLEKEICPQIENLFKRSITDIADEYGCEYRKPILCTSITFDNGYTATIGVYNGFEIYEYPCAVAMLYDKEGNFVMRSEVRKQFTGEWILEYRNTEYKIFI